MLFMAHRYHASVLVVVNGSAEIARLVAARGFDVTIEFPPSFDALVHVPDLSAATPAPLAELDDREWDRRGEAVLRDALHACRQAYRAMHENGGRIVLVVPTIALVGADGRAPFAMACEGIRTLAKAAARQWGSARITANCVAPSLDAFGIEHDALGSVAPALGRPTDLDDVVTVIAALLGDTGAAVTGVTIPVDGGVTMS
jgi:3-oxoacyl-[acyl-carrier protein] reductase